MAARVGRWILSVRWRTDRSSARGVGKRGRDSTAAGVGGTYAHIGLRRQEFQAEAGGLQVVSLDPATSYCGWRFPDCLRPTGIPRSMGGSGVIPSAGQSETACRTAGGWRRAGRHYARPAKRYAISLKGEAGIITVDGARGDCDFVIQLGWATSLPEVAGGRSGSRRAEALQQPRRKSTWWRPGFAASYQAMEIIWES